MSLVSVIIPVHNSARYLKKCVESVRNQTLQDIEIILVENLSSDGSFELCDEYARMDSRIKVLHLDIADPSTARNEGIKIAVSPYLGFIDSDDYIEPGMYELMLDALRTNHADMAYSNLRYESEEGQLLSSVPDTEQIKVEPATEGLKDIFRGKLDSSVCSKLFKRELFLTVAFPGKSFFEDHSIIYELVNRSSSIVHIDRPFYHYVQRDGSITHDWTFKKYYDHFCADYGRVEFIREHPIFGVEEYRAILSHKVGACLVLFRDGQLVANKEDRKLLIPLMRKKLRGLFSAKDEMDGRVYRRLKKMVYLGPFVRVFYKLRYRIQNKKLTRPFT